MIVSLGWFKISYSLHTAYSILGPILSVLLKFAMVLMKTETAQAFMGYTKSPLADEENQYAN